MENFDIHRFLKVLTNSKFYIIAILVLFLTMGYFYSFHYVAPMYRSSATVVLVQTDSTSSEDASITQKDITLNQNLLTTYTKIAKSDKVLSQVIQNLGLSTSVSQLSGLVNIQAVNNTEVFKISVSNKDPNLAASITNELLTVFSKEVQNLYHMNNVYTMDQAEASATPYNINHAKDLILFAGLGFMVSMALVVAFYLLDTTIKSEQDIEEYANLNVLSTIPVYQGTIGSELIVKEQPKSPISECFKTFRTNIMFSIQNKKLNTILVTSGYTSEGKSFVSSNLAVTFAQSGKKVILIDTDMRKGRQHKIFGVSHKNGLSNCLSSLTTKGTQVNINDYIQETSVPNLHLMTSGDVPPNPSELLSSTYMKKFLEALNTQYDIVICDGTPCMLVSDSVILSKIVDTTVIVTANKITKLDTLLKIKKSIEMVGGSIGGTIINKMTVNAKAYQNQYYYGNHNEIDTKLEPQISTSASLLANSLCISNAEVVVEDVQVPVLQETSYLETSPFDFSKDMTEVKSQMQQIKDMYKTFMQSALDSKLQDSNTNTRLLQELNTVKQLYHDSIQEQSVKMNSLTNKLDTLELSNINTDIISELTSMRESYESRLEEQHQQIQNLTDTLSHLEMTDSSNMILEELAHIKEDYQMNIQNQQTELALLTNKLDEINSVKNSNVIQEEIIALKEVYQIAFEKQSEELKQLQISLSTMNDFDDTALLEKFEQIDANYQEKMEQQSNEIASLANKIDSIQIPEDSSEIILDEIYSLKDSYKTILAEQSEKLLSLQDNLSSMKEFDDTALLEKFEQIDASYQEKMEQQTNEIASLANKIDSIQIPEDSSEIILDEIYSLKDSYKIILEKQIEENSIIHSKLEKIQSEHTTETIAAQITNLKQFYEQCLSTQEKELKNLSDKLATLETNTFIQPEVNINVDSLLQEFSKVSSYLENMDKRFDLLEQKANHQETLIHQMLSVNENQVLTQKEQKFIDMKKLNTKVIQLEDYLEKQPIQLPITVEPSIKSNKKNKSILEGQLTIMDSIRNDNTSMETEKEEKYAINYEKVQNRSKHTFNFFKNKKQIEEPEEPIMVVSQILSKNTIENVG